ncbi:MAG: FGGY family carbohydrate kinase [Candidatus Bathyarchaeia archaeon]
MTVLIGLDVGTTGVRMECYTVDGEVISSGRATIERQETDHWLEAIEYAARSAVTDEVAGDPEKLLTIQSTSGTAILVDEYGRPVFPPQMYYERAAPEAEELSRLPSAQELSRKGETVSATSPLPKIIRLRRSSPEAFKKVKWILSPTTWLLYRLRLPEGVKWLDVETDWTNALKFGEDITSERPEWFKPVFMDAGVSLELLPSIVECGAYIGEAESSFASKIGVKKAKLYQGMTDGNAAALALGCFETADFGFTCGTTTAIKYVSRELKPNKAIYYHKHPFKGYLAGAAPVTAGVLEWFAKKILGISVAEAMNLAQSIEPGEEPIYFPQGDRSPFYDASLGAAMIKIWPDEIPDVRAKGRLIRAIVTGLTLFEDSYIQLFEELFPEKISEVRITGGGSKTKWWNQLRATIYQRPVKVVEERPGIGALIPVVMKEKLYETLREAERNLIKVLSIEYPGEIPKPYVEMREKFMERWRLIQQASQ